LGWEGDEAIRGEREWELVLHDMASSSRDRHIPDIEMDVAALSSHGNADS
jgi:hypothetical protein